VADCHTNQYGGADEAGEEAERENVKAEEHDEIRLSPNSLLTSLLPRTYLFRDGVTDLIGDLAFVWRRGGDLTRDLLTVIVLVGWWLVNVDADSNFKLLGWFGIPRPIKHGTDRMLPFSIHTMYTKGSEKYANAKGVIETPGAVVTSAIVWCVAAVYLRLTVRAWRTASPHPLVRLYSS